MARLTFESQEFSEIPGFLAIFFFLGIFLLKSKKIKEKYTNNRFSHTNRVTILSGTVTDGENLYNLSKFSVYYNF